ncbi:thioredoxin domain-containing protein [Novosphingobium sp. Rr 2-17]|uniref:thioredoxin domain-containing protein n=1 Tax=Novosphingobium sp. Rr 2-17 TaxID=555793 RepID=UPI0012F6ADC3|nr:thioredoxin domain-containing protein [Novosphingobium sp. Rr 2-17]
MKTALGAALLIAGAGAALAATPKKPAAPAQKAAAKSAPGGNWLGQVDVVGNLSHRIGNPDAPVKLAEYVSYTCPHCAHFHKEADPLLRQTMIPKGQVSVTITNLLRNPIDLTAAMLTNCGDPKRFFTRHNAFFDTQDTWMAKLETTSREQQTRWYQGDMPTRMKAIATDLDFYKMVAGWGITRAKADACFADQATLDKIKAQQEDVARLGFESTPSFSINDKPMDVHDWASVSKAITAKLAEQRAGNI